MTPGRVSRVIALGTATAWRGRSFSVYGSGDLAMHRRAPVACIAVTLPSTANSSTTKESVQMMHVDTAAARPAAEPGYIAVKIGTRGYLIPSKLAYHLANDIADALDSRVPVHTTRSAR